MLATGSCYLCLALAVTPRPNPPFRGVEEGGGRNLAPPHFKEPRGRHLHLETLCGRDSGLQQGPAWGHLTLTVMLSYHETLLHP